jgi:hypothetical protein
MAGAGTSLSRYGSWNDALRALGELATQHGVDFAADDAQMQSDPLAYAQEAKTALRAAGDEGEARYLEFLGRRFGPRPLDQFGELHELLVSLPFCGIMTTNYDPCFVAAIAKLVPGSFDAHRILGGPPDGVDDWIRSLNVPGERLRRVLHCHGYYLAPESIVLTTEDYRALYEPPSPTAIPDGESGPTRVEATTATQVLRMVLVGWPVLFIGFSLRDPYFLALIDFIKSRLWRFDADESPTIVLLSQDERDAATQLRNDLGVRTILYDRIDQEHEGLRLLVRRIHSNCGRQVPTSPATGAESWLLQTYDRVRRRVESR